MIPIAQKLEGGPSLTCTLDNLVIYVDSPSITAWQEFDKTLHLGEHQCLLPAVYRALGNGASEYRHNMHIGRGGGAILVSWKHNSERPSHSKYRMRVEFNPSKQDSMTLWFWEQFRISFEQYKKYIKQLDLAFDYPVHVDNVAAISLTGKDRSFFKNTRYFGSSGKSGRLKIYDKKKELKEKQGIEIENEFLTRIEYTKKFEEPFLISYLVQVDDLAINEEYSLTSYNLGANQGVIKAAIIAIQNCEMEMKEFSQSYKVKIKKAFTDMEKFDLDHDYRNAKSIILDNIRLYID